MALNAQQIQGARDWINQQYGSFSPTGAYSFNGDFSIDAPGFNRPEEAYIFGAAQALGYSDSDIAQILGSYTPQTIMDHRLQAFPEDSRSINDQSILFAMDQGWTTPNDYKLQLYGGGRSTAGDQYAWQGGADGGFVRTYDAQQSTIDTPGRGGSAYIGQGGGPGRGGMGAMGGSGINNPYWQGLMDDISRQYTQTLTESWLPSIRSSAIASGGLGGARQTLGEDNAIARAGQGLSSALTGLGGNLWEGQQQRDLTRYGIDTSAALQNQGQWMGYDSAQRGLDLQSIGLGSQIMGMGQQMPWYGLNQMGGLLGSAAGNNNTTQNNYGFGGGWPGLIGGALAGGALGRQMNWWGD